MTDSDPTPQLPERMTPPAPEDQLDTQQQVAQLRNLLESFQTTEITYQAEFYAGPFPHPGMLRACEDIVPGSAERMITLAEDQSRHRMYLERRVVDGDTRRADRGLIAGTVVVLVIVGLCGYVISQGQTLEGLVGVITALAALMGAFLYTSRQRSQERQDRLNRMLPPRPAPPQEPPAEDEV